MSRDARKQAVKTCRGNYDACMSGTVKILRKEYKKDICGEHPKLEGLIAKEIKKCKDKFYAELQAIQQAQ